MTSIGKLALQVADLLPSYVVIVGDGLRDYRANCRGLALALPAPSLLGDERLLTAQYER